MSAPADSLGKIVLDDAVFTFTQQKRIAEAAMSQIDDADFFRTLDAESNSIAVIAKHVGGNLRSRWRDFLTTDGEKADRDRDSEFVVPGETSRAEVMATWESGWATLFGTLASLDATSLTATITIRGEAMTAVQAMQRAVSHIGQHVGQIVLLAKHYRAAEWKTLSIPRGRSAEYLTAAAPR